MLQNRFPIEFSGEIRVDQQELDLYAQQNSINFSSIKHLI